MSPDGKVDYAAQGASLHLVSEMRRRAAPAGAALAGAHVKIKLQAVDEGRRALRTVRRRRHPRAGLSQCSVLSGSAGDWGVVLPACMPGHRCDWNSALIHFGLCRPRVEFPLPSDKSTPVCQIAARPGAVRGCAAHCALRRGATHDLPCVQRARKRCRAGTYVKLPHDPSMMGLRDR